jgi:2-pyrone-4,6-dicarboxylate lactonase
VSRSHHAPKVPLPPGAADCHMHVFGPYDRFPLAAERAYNVPEASLEEHERMKAAVGLERTVFVQASGYGTDNRAMLAALEQTGVRGRGVAVVALQTPRAELQRMHKVGVRGLRLNFYTLPDRHIGEAASQLHAYERLVASLGWHLQLFCSPPTLLNLASAIERCSVPVVIDHMGMPNAGHGLDQQVFETVLNLVRGKAWVKIAGADRITRTTDNLGDALPFMRALVRAAPQRIVWGSDWPNIGFHMRRQVRDDSITPHRDVDAGRLLDLLSEAVPDRAQRDAILVDNPQALYAFE